MSGGDDDETTSTRAKKPRAPILPAVTTETAPQRPTVPLIGRGSARRGATPNDDFGERPDDAPTMFDPNVPTGARGPTEDERRTNQGPAQPDPFPDLEDNDRPTGATVIGKRPRVLPVDTAENTKKSPPRFEAPARLDDSSRTNKWEAPQVMQDAEPTGPAMRPPPMPGPQLPLPPVLPLRPGPQSEPIHVVSMKAPAAADAEKQARPVREVRLRAMSDVHQTPPRGMGFLAPPRDPKEARSRRWRDNIIWGSVAVIVAAVVMLAVWFIAR